MEGSWTLYGSKKEVVTQVILTPKREDVAWDIERESEDYSYGYDYGRLPIGAPKYIFDSSDWDIQAELGPSKKYAELIERLGEGAANDAWEVLFG